MRLGIVLGLAIAGMCTACTMDPVKPVDRSGFPPTTQVGGRINIEAQLRCCFVEGGYFFVLVVDEEGKTPVQKHFAMTDRAVTVRYPLPPRTYKLLTWSTGCAPSGCASGFAQEELDDPPGYACVSELVVSAGRTVTATIPDPFAVGASCDVMIT